jgi:hypothetical protein
MHLTVFVNISGLSPSPSGRGLGRGGFNQTAVYPLKYRMSITQYFMVPEPYNFIAERFKEYASLYIIFHLLQVLPAIGLHNQSCFKTHEINNVRLNYNLTLELVAGHSMSTQVLP